MNAKFFRRIAPVMSKVRLAKGVLVGAALVAGISAGRAWGTPGSGSQSTLLGRATFDDPIYVRRVGEDNWKVAVKAKPALDVAVQSIVFQPGGQSGWHSHPGPVFISVVAGEMTFYESDDPDCEPIVRRVGEGYLDTGEHAHIARNETTEPATNVVTYFAPPGAALRIDQPDPGNCSF
jgi:hypothetical protein